MQNIQTYILFKIIRKGKEKNFYTQLNNKNSLELLNFEDMKRLINQSFF